MVTYPINLTNNQNIYTYKIQYQHIILKSTVKHSKYWSSYLLHGT